MASLFTNPMLAGTFGNNDNTFGLEQNLYGTATYPTFVNHPPPQQQQQNPTMFNTVQMPVSSTSTITPIPTSTTNPSLSSASHNNDSNNTSTSAMFGTPPATSGLGISSSGAGEPPMDGLLSMDPDAMNAFLQYNTTSFSSSFDYQQQAHHQQQQQQMMSSDMMFASGNRKRQRDWDQQEN
ncbi:hypothetical protein BCR42DRAFT_413707 [Absidia repens]|uniref:Uncharacterized protein n=1 Tax=Absidia repens TaxID=90262 RepID=A0A1X2IHW5_9FUNG|nr:hypothetical protein BCR42DRAFT_413707 [Absidia repens]